MRIGNHNILITKGLKQKEDSICPVPVNHKVTDFDSLPWEACSVRRITLPLIPFLDGFERGPLFNLNYIIEVLPSGDYWHSPATLEFHGITDLNITLGNGDSGFQMAPSEFLIDGLKRELVQNQKVYLDRPYYHWDIQLSSSPQSSHLSFGAYGFTFLVEEPALSKPPHWAQEVRE